MRKLNFWMPLREPKWHTPICPSIHLPPPPPPEDFLSPLVLGKMKEDYFSQLDDYDEPFCEQQYMHGSCLFVCLFKFKSFDQFNSPPPPPRTASNFRHLLSCGTTGRNCACSRAIKRGVVSALRPKMRSQVYRRA